MRFLLSTPHCDEIAQNFTQNYETFYIAVIFIQGSGKLLKALACVLKNSAMIDDKFSYYKYKVIFIYLNESQIFCFYDERDQLQ